MRALSRSNLAYVRSILAEEIAFDEGEGRAEFIAAWRLDGPEGRIFLSELHRALSLGCVHEAEDEEPEARAPYFGAAEDDLWGRIVATMAGAPLRTGPTDDAPIAATLDWHLLEILGEMVTDEGEETGWLMVRTGSGIEGFVRIEHVRGGEDYRAVFRKVQGRWRLVSFQTY
jgi:hypothetical protein